MKYYLLGMCRLLNYFHFLIVLRVLLIGPVLNVANKRGNKFGFLHLCNTDVDVGHVVEVDGKYASARIEK